MQKVFWTQRAKISEKSFALSVLKRCVPKTLAFAFGLRLRSKTRCFKTRVLGRRLPIGKPQERLRFRDLRSKTLAFKKRNAIAFCDLKTSLGARACVQVLCVQKTRRFAFAFLSPLSFCTTQNCFCTGAKAGFMLLGSKPCPSFPWFSGIPWLNLSKEFPWLFLCFPWFFPRFGWVRQGTQNPWLI